MMKNLPKELQKAFPSLVSATYIRELASLTPIKPDTVFDIFRREDNTFLALVGTDYADPMRQSAELKSISGEYAFEFTSLLLPWSNLEATILPFEDMPGDFFIKFDQDNQYYYVAKLGYSKK